MSTQDFNLSGFKSINVRFAMEVEIRRADTYSVSISGSEALLENINIFLEGDRLVIGYHLNIWSFFSAPFTRARAVISMPEIKDLQISGAARVSLSGFDAANEFSLYVSGASQLNISSFRAANMIWELSGASHIEGQVQLSGNLDIRVSGASKIYLKGSARDAFIEASGASHIDLLDFKIDNAKIRLNGASRSFVNINGKLDVDLNGASNLEYGGNATMGDVRVNGASSLKKH